MNKIDRIAGEIKLSLDQNQNGKVNLSDLNGDISGYYSKGGHMRLLVDLDAHNDNHFFKMPTLQFKYDNNVGETQWIVEFNGETIVDKLDHQGNSTTILLNRSKLEELVQRHENQLLIHVEFPEEVNLLPAESSIHLYN